MYKVGDRVYISGNYGTITDYDISLDMYTVVFDGDSIAPSYSVKYSASVLAASTTLPLPLPIGSCPVGGAPPPQVLPSCGCRGNKPQGFKQITEDIEFFDESIISQLKQLTCDCGGFKTFNTMSPESHSSWCSSRQHQQQKT